MLFANPLKGSPVLSKLIKSGYPPEIVITTLKNIDSWKTILYRYITGKFTVEDKLRFFYKIDFYDYRILNAERLKKIIDKHNIEIGFITTFSYILKKEIIECFPKGIFNFHSSLLPEHGGPNPIYWILKNRDEYTGTTCYKITEKIDNGDIILQTKFRVGNYTEKKLWCKFFDDINNMLPKVLKSYDYLISHKKEMGETKFDPAINRDK
jgi:methionyl-tRNA formyltransferase